jgi:hypothetical protein
MSRNVCLLLVVVLTLSALADVMAQVNSKNCGWTKCGGQCPPGRSHVAGGIVERDIEYIAEAVRRDIPFGAPCKGVAKILCCTGNQQVPYGPPSNEEPTINPNYEW